jgi:hypothetical protein
LRNDSGIPWNSIVLEVRCFDAQRRLSDVLHDCPTAFLTVPANSEAAFRTRVDAARAKEGYVYHEVRVTDAVHAKHFW